MQPKSFPIFIVATAAIALGVALIAIGITLPQWIITSSPEREKIGLFELCQEGEDCHDVDDKSKSVEIVTALCLIGGISGFLAFVTTSAHIYMFRKRIGISCMALLPWATLLWSLVTGGAITAALVIFEAREYDSGNDYSHLGISFVSTATGGVLVVLGGLFFSAWSHRLSSYLKRVEMKELENSTIRERSLQSRRMRKY